MIIKNARIRAYFPTKNNHFDQLHSVFLEKSI